MSNNPLANILALFVFGCIILSITALTAAITIRLVMWILAL